MAILAGLASMLGRFAGRFLNTTLGWATVLLFGKVAANRQGLLLVMVLGALAWVALIIGVLIPDVGSLLIAAVPLPDFVDEGWVRLGMLIGALIVPALIGLAALFIQPADQRPRGAGLARSVLRGYPFTAVLAVTIVVLAVVATVRKLKAMARRWETAHVPVIVKPGAYDEVLAQLSDVLNRAGLEHRVRAADQFVSTPPKLLDAVAGRSFGALVPDRLMELVGPGLEVLVYPSDVAITGTKDHVARARAAIAAQLTHAPAYMTTTAEAQRFEDDLARARRGEVELDALDARLAGLAVPFEEWETLYRQRLQVELGDPGPAGQPAPVVERAARPSRLDVAVAVGGLALVALDIVLITTRPRRPE